MTHSLGFGALDDPSLPQKAVLTITSVSATPDAVQLSLTFVHPAPRWVETWEREVPVAELEALATWFDTSLGDRDEAPHACPYLGLVFTFRWFEKGELYFSVDVDTPSGPRQVTDFVQGTGRWLADRIRSWFGAGAD
jgi:hypothetical protein